MRLESPGSLLLSGSCVLAASLVRRMIIQDSRTRELVPSAALDQIGRARSLLSARLRASAASVARRIRSALREATRPLPLVTGFVTDLDGQVELAHSTDGSQHRAAP
jgi:hypothetical protein